MYMYTRQSKIRLEFFWTKKKYFSEMHINEGERGFFKLDVGKKNEEQIYI